MNHCVSELMIAPFSGNERDVFGKDKPLLPKAMEGYPIASKNILLGLPLEILGAIMDLIAEDKATLSALALVNSDCRQLARSCQFAHVCFDYSPNSRLLLLHLVKEAVTRLDHDDLSRGSRPLFIGSCIRKVVVRPRPEWVAHAHSDLYDSIWGDAARRLPLDHRNKLSEEATDQYNWGYRSPIQIAMSLAMPHLKTLVWRDRLCLDGAFFTAVANLPLRHLKLAGVHIGEAHRLEVPATPPTMPLESLSLGIGLCNNERSHKDKIIADADADADAWGKRSLSPLITTILQRCSTTLRRLTLSYHAYQGDPSLSFGHEHITFPRLRYLDISHIMCNPDVRVWSLLFCAPLRHLSLCCTKSPAFQEALFSCEPLRDLETLVIPYLAGEDVTEVQPMIDLLFRHPHVRRLSIGRTAPQLVDSHLVPLLSDGRWSNLSSLSLVWSQPGTDAETQQRTAVISTDSLVAIGSIDSLEQIWLSAGSQFGWRHQWLIDHDTVRSCLQRLAKLKKLAFSRDTYQALDGGLGLDAESYYEQRHVTSTEEEDALERPELDGVGHVEHAEERGDNGDSPEFGGLGVWERAHRNRMLREGEKYAAAFPCLKWMYCGQWPMEIRKVGASGSTVRAVPLGKERDSCATLLDRMFAMVEDDE